MQISIEDHGSVVLLRPQTSEARMWLEEHVASEPWQWFGGALACEPRYVDDVLNAFESR